MYVSIAEAEGQLLDLVRRAEAGEEVLLTHEGKVVGKLHASAAREEPLSAEERLRRLKSVATRFRPIDDGGPDAARSQDFLYDENGLPA